MQDDSKLEMIRAYKLVIREALETRPSGIRMRIAVAIGKNKSFISQITNPKYTVPLPEKYVEPILEILHFTPAERSRFLDLYRAAHPRSRDLPAARVGQKGGRTLAIEMPRLGSRTLEQLTDDLVKDFARRLSDLLDQAGG